MSTSTVFEKPISKVSQLINDTGFYVKPSSGIPSSDIASGVIPNVPVQDIQVDNVSILQNGIAGLKYATSSRYGLTQMAKDTDIKAGIALTYSLQPARQHIATFYGLCKAAGVDMANSSNEVGVYTPEAITAIQKMLGVYEAPWELIKEDTFTNVTEADHTITTDSLGQSFALTDFVMWFETPKQSNYAKKGYYGQIHFYLNDTNNIIAPEPGGWEQQADANAHGFVIVGEQHHGMMIVQAMAQTTYTNSGAIRYRYMTIGNMNMERQSGIFPIYEGLGTHECYIPRVIIKSVTGTGHYKLYGRRRAT